MAGSERSRGRARGFQFTLSTLLAATAWVALICVGLRTPTLMWTVVITFLTLIAILSSALVAVYLTGRIRAAALGFLLFGGGYLVANEHLRVIELTDARDWLFKKVHPSGVDEIVQGVQEVVARDPFAPTNDPSERQTRSDRMDLMKWVNFRAIVSSAVAMLLGSLGAVVAQVLFTIGAQQGRDRGQSLAD